MHDFANYFFIHFCSHVICEFLSNYCNLVKIPDKEIKSAIPPTVVVMIIIQQISHKQQYRYPKKLIQKSMPKGIKKKE
jgi:hypothetical protein